MSRRSLLLIVIGTLTLSSCFFSSAERRDPAELSPELQTELSAWLAAEGADPVPYVVGLFAERDVVFLGEWHRIRHDVLLVQDLIAPLHAAGVTALATEFARREDQHLVDALLAAPAWDEDLARRIVFDQFVFWGFREYVDVLRAAWERNRNQPADAAPFRILAVNDSPDWSLIEEPGDRDDPKVMRKVWRGGGEHAWARVILDEVARGGKVVVHCGIHHAFTKYRQPRVSDGEFHGLIREPRCGNHVHEALGERSATVFLHAPWPGRDGYGTESVHPAGGAIDALMLATTPRPVGFDVADGPFGELRVRDAVYAHGHDDFRLADFCDGWIYTRPLSAYEGVAPLTDWFRSDNLEAARQGSPNPRFRTASLEELRKAIARDAAIERRFAHLR